MLQQSSSLSFSGLSVGYAAQHGPSGGAATLGPHLQGSVVPAEI